MYKSQLHLSLAMGLVFFSFMAEASTLAFDNLSAAQVNSVIEEFSANFTHTSVSGASSLGSVFGFQLGLVAGATKVPEIAELAKLADPTISTAVVPHAGILAMLSIPYGVTFETSLVPAVGSNEFKFRNIGLGVKWTLTESVLPLPLSLAVKAHLMKTHLEFQQVVSSVNSKIGFDDSVSGLGLYISENFVFIEPYLGLGVLRGKGDFDVTGTSSFFSFTTASTYSATRSSPQVVLGVEGTLLFVRLGVELARQFGTTSGTAKLAFSF